MLNSISNFEQTVQEILFIGTEPHSVFNPQFEAISHQANEHYVSIELNLFRVLSSELNNKAVNRLLVFSYNRLVGVSNRIYQVISQWKAMLQPYHAMLYLQLMENCMVYIERIIGILILSAPQFLFNELPCCRSFADKKSKELNNLFAGYAGILKENRVDPSMIEVFDQFFKTLVCESALSFTFKSIDYAAYILNRIKQIIDNESAAIWPEALWELMIGHNLNTELAMHYAKNRIDHVLDDAEYLDGREHLKHLLLQTQVVPMHLGWNYNDLNQSLKTRYEELIKLWQQKMEADQEQDKQDATQKNRPFIVMGLTVMEINLLVHLNIGILRILNPENHVHKVLAYFLGTKRTMAIERSFESARKKRGLISAAVVRSVYAYLEELMARLKKEFGHMLE